MTDVSFYIPFNAFYQQALYFSLDDRGSDDFSIWNFKVFFNPLTLSGNGLGHG
jgi:hypothetical protein